MSPSVRIKLNNPALLTWARKSAGYTEDEIATSVQRSADTIRAWERGEAAPTYRQLQRFAKKVRRPVATLFLPHVPEDPGPPKDFRVLPEQGRDIFTPEALRAFRELRNNLAKRRVLLDELGDPISFALPERPDVGGDVILQAAELRDLLGVTFDTQIQWRDKYEALNQWRDILFDRGILVQVFPMPVEDARAFSLLEQNLGGVGLSSKDAPLARIFSLFHEVAHLCLRKPGVSGQVSEADGTTESETECLERHCDAFAAAFLLPDDHPAVVQAMQALEQEFTVGLAQRYANKFKVSKYVIARRLVDLGGIDPGTYWSQTDAWRNRDADIAARSRQKPGGADFVVVKVSHAGRRYVAAVMDAVDRDIITTYEAGKILALKPDRLEKAQSLAV